MIKYLLVTIMVLITTVTFSKPTKGVPAKLQVALILKLLPFNKNLTGDISIHVINAPEVATELKAVIGKSFGSFKLAKVTEGDSPETGSNIIPNLTSKVTIVFLLIKVFLFVKKRKTLISQTPLKEPKLATL